MSKETFYFSHDYNSRNDMKIKKLIVKHGYQGYGIFWALIEDLYQNANALPLDYDCIAYDLRSDSDIIESIINDFDLFKIDGDTFGSLSVQRRLDKRNERSRKARKSAMKRWGSNAKALPKKCEGNAIKESKVKESKVNSIVDTTVSTTDAAHPTQEKIDYRAIINFFNDETQGVFGKLVYPITDKRKKSIRARIEDFGKDGFAEMVRKASRSDFLKGKVSDNFAAKFDWMIEPDNFQKILEGNYDNRIKGYGADNQSGDEELMQHIKQGIARGLQESAT